MRHIFFHSYAFDLGIFVQALYTTWSNQKLFFETPDNVISESYFGIHFSPILFLMVPLIGLLPFAETLLIFQTIILALPAYFIYKDVYSKTQQEKLASLASIWYLLNPVLHCINLYDFHTQSLMILPSYFLLKSLKNHDIKKSAILLILLFTMTEQTLFIALGCITYLLLTRSHWKKEMLVRGLIVFMSITILMTSIAFITISTFGKPPISPENPVKFFPQLGNTWAEVIYNIFSFKIVDAIVNDLILKVFYWLIILFPFYLYNRRIVLKETIPFLLPWMIFTFLSGYRPLYTLGWQFGGLILGFVTATAQEIIKGYIKTKLRSYIIIIFIPAILLSPISIIPYFLARNLNIPMESGAAYSFNPFSVDISNELEIASTIRIALSLIPRDASILCTSNIFPHVATRLNAYVGNVREVEYILLDYRYVSLEHFNQRLMQLVSILNESCKYGVLLHANGILLLKANYTSRPQLLKPYKVYVYPNMLSWSEITPSFYNVRCVKIKFATDEEKLIWFGPYLTIPPGLYKVKLNVLRNFEGKLTIKVVNYVSGEILAVSNEDTFQLRIPIDNIIELKGYCKGVGELTLYSIEVELVNI